MIRTKCLRCHEYLPCSDYEGSTPESESIARIYQHLCGTLIHADNLRALSSEPVRERGRYEALICKDIPTDCCDYGVISHESGKEICRVWDEYYARLIADLLNAEPAQGEQYGITISALQSAHIERQKEWCPDQQPDLSFRGNEMAGEVGEACNVIKKLERERQGWRGSRSSKEELASELADVIHTAILCAVTAGIDLETATVEKFNATSVKNDLQTLLPAAPTPEAEG
ncbi:NTP pyrophosphatase (non-canonical NTP hydrolase) [Paenochrobactrum gallinarii]|uniref:NTP pyrophosphatase (Non-canonical NTP hydrolase) n=1 Tax=Paenochrobactrum gallinarii TaxID=643673 RepID=A0A841MAG8_9HYPH|nr:MazG-like family protein [Paenochrobactrum gallinarii]MBB6262524.1 NTP pyrophosphatase (non-canonical NTP hydrolase) [Paenochrobactrum gallinarii]